MHKVQDFDRQDSLDNYQLSDLLVTKLGDAIAFPHPLPVLNWCSQVLRGPQPPG